MYLNNYNFLAGGGEMAQLIRSVDWDKTPVGPMDHWPPSLRLAISMILESQFPMYIAWGNAFTQFYNDSFKTVLGPLKHPQALGNSSKDSFAEVWDILEPLLSSAYQGQASGFKDLMLPLNRFGYTEECYFASSYSPIREETGEIAGILVTVLETTDRLTGESLAFSKNINYDSGTSLAQMLNSVENVVERNASTFLRFKEQERMGFVHYRAKRLLKLENIQVDQEPIQAKKVTGTHPHDIQSSVSEFKTKKTAELQKQVNPAVEVNKQRRLLKALYESEHRYCQLIQGLPVALYACDPSGRIIFYNQAASDLWGRQPELGKDLWCGAWLIYRTDGTLLPHDQSPMAIAIREGRAILGEEIIIERSDGVRFHVLVYPKPIFDISGNMVEAVNMLVDITGHKRVELALQESEERFRKLADAAPMLIWLTGIDRKCFYLNKTWLDFTGQKLGAGMSESWIECIHPDDREQFIRSYKVAFESRSNFQIDYRLRSADNNYRWVLNHGMPLYTPANEFLGYIGSCIDITERIELEHQKNELIGIASHELKTPITSIKAYTEYLHSNFRDKGDWESAFLISKMDKQVERLTKLIYHFLDVTKIQAGNFKLYFTRFNLKRLIEENVDILQQSTKKHKLNLELHMPDKVHGDKERIGQVLHNFITNAIKYSPNPSTIHIRAIATDNNMIEISVKDNGIGIPANMREKVFDRFFRIDHKSTGTYPGAGLSLFISKEIIRQHGGNIWMESQEGAGSTFYFSIPINKDL